jgi:hypothetical protein
VRPLDDAVLHVEDEERSVRPVLECGHGLPDDAVFPRQVTVDRRTDSWSDRTYPEPVDLEFSGEMWFWKGPAPWHFITVPEEECGELDGMSGLVSYGWGMIPVTARIGRSGWKTSLFPKDGRYIVPVKGWVREAERLEVGDTVRVRLAVEV